MSNENGGYLTSHCKSCEYWLDGYSWDFGCGHLYFENCPYLNPVDVDEPIPKKEYAYNGPVFIFDECVQTRWKAKTKAVSRQKARSNFTYQWKKENGYSMNTKVTLSGRIAISE